MKNLINTAKIIVVIGIIILTACGNTSKNINIAPNAFLVDVRTPKEFAEGSAKGAVNIPLNEIESRLSEFKEKPSIVVFCRSGSRANSAKHLLEENGFKNIENGGSWQQVNEQLHR